MIYLLDVLSPSLTFLDMVQFEQYDTNPIVTVETDANTEVNLTFYGHKLPLLYMTITLIIIMIIIMIKEYIFPKMC